MKKVLLTSLFLFCIVGCNDPYWRFEQAPETPQERIAVAQLEIDILKAVQLNSLSGHDQDWDDAIKMAHKVAIKTICKKRLYEVNSTGAYTGRMKEIKEGE